MQTQDEIYFAEEDRAREACQRSTRAAGVLRIDHGLRDYVRSFIVETGRPALSVVIDEDRRVIRIVGGMQTHEMRYERMALGRSTRSIRAHALAELLNALPARGDLVTDDKNVPAMVEAIWRTTSLADCEIWPAARLLAAHGYTKVPL